MLWMKIRLSILTLVAWVLFMPDGNYNLKLGRPGKGGNRYD